MKLVNKLAKKQRRILNSRWLPWSVLLIVLIVILLGQFSLPEPWIAASPTISQLVIGGTVLLVFILVYLIINRLMVFVDQRVQLQNQIEEADRFVATAYQRLELIFTISQRFVEASDENEIIEPVLQSLVDLIGAKGASFVPLDEHGQPQSALRSGELPSTASDVWLEYLASPVVRDRCGNCKSYDTQFKPPDCPLMTGPFVDAKGLLCLPVRRGEREFGLLTIFFPEEKPLDERTRAYLRALIDETALGLDSVRLRRRELASLRRMQSLRQKSDLKALLNALLENVYHTMEADIAVMVVPQRDSAATRLDVVLGDLPQSARPFVDGILQGVLSSAEPVLLADVSGDPASAPQLRSLMAVPLISSEKAVVGAVLIANRRKHAFRQRQLALLQTVAGQVALVVQNASLMAELEYNSMMQERTRLAREIHDGLAQTLGYLKLQAAQMRAQLARGEIERVNQAMDKYYAVLSEAYQDARQAIDGLRITPGGCDLAGWLRQTVGEFEEISGLPVELKLDVESHLPTEYHAQLVRILQEALSNVRKHAQANQVWIDCYDQNGDLILEIRDDGIGFSPDDISSASRHGLRGMRERSDLIRADFQVISRPQEGASVRVRLPLKDIEEIV